jgi:hypothetical protein
MLQMAKQQFKRIEEKSHFHSSLPSPEMSKHKTLYKYRLKHQNWRKYYRHSKATPKTINKENLN